MQQREGPLYPPRLPHRVPNARNWGIPCGFVHVNWCISSFSHRHSQQYIHVGLCFMNCETLGRIVKACIVCGITPTQDARAGGPWPIFANAPPLPPDIRSVRQMASTPHAATGFPPWLHFSAATHYRSPDLPRTRCGRVMQHPTSSPAVPIQMSGST